MGETLDLFATVPIEELTPAEPECGFRETPAPSWCEDILKSAMSDRKERLKLLQDNAQEYGAVLSAIAVIGLRKCQAYAQACSGSVNPDPLFGWVARDVELAQATVVLARHHIGWSDIPLAA